ncbi:hypothetical protein PPTG_12198 [Phytophthora nicotianae INRA-310]|uniref:RxLR effector protein n=1 Tax=Phytophthora nicotianae (strain INRA-310) TaxID=761204 RepID=W2Q5E1_PHYN3|nr:hypothetical protein PPTG_12198 [Phytophthora nicotianae INRA-310]ETN08398.1 hypothetical protein PPTG_12198 [Phytophthora nicotianae INRA-310]
MAGPQLRFATLLLLLLAVACVGSVSAEAPFAPETRLLRQHVHESVDSVTQTAILESSSTSNSDSGSGPEQESATANTETAETSTSTHHKGPTMMSFAGPTIAGVLAIVLIGAVVTFKNRMGK